MPSPPARTVRRVNLPEAAATPVGVQGWARWRSQPLPADAGPALHAAIRRSEGRAAYTADISVTACPYNVHGPDAVSRRAWVAGWAGQAALDGHDLLTFTAPDPGGEDDQPNPWGAWWGSTPDG